MKVLVIGLAKSGTSIISNCIAQSLPKCQYIFEPKNDIDLDDYSGNAVIKCLVSNVFMIRDSIPGIKIRNIEKDTKIVWILRNPIDCIISGFFYNFYKAHNPTQEQYNIALEMVQRKLDDPEFSLKEMVDAVMPNYWTEYLAQHIRYQAGIFDDTWRRMNNSVCINYEDFMCIRNFTLTLLSKFLGKRIKYHEIKDESLRNRLVRNSCISESSVWLNSYEKKVYDFIPEIIPKNLDREQIIKNSLEFMKKIYQG